MSWSFVLGRAAGLFLVLAVAAGCTNADGSTESEAGASSSAIGVGGAGGPAPGVADARLNELRVGSFSETFSVGAAGVPGPGPAGVSEGYVEIEGPVDEDLGRIALVVIGQGRCGLLPDGGPPPPGCVNSGLIQDIVLFDAADQFNARGMHVTSQETGFLFPVNPTGEGGENNTDLSYLPGFMNLTFLLVQWDGITFPHDPGEDLDTDDDGTLDIIPGSYRFDAVALDFGSGGFTYAPSISDAQHIQRCTDRTGAWEAGVDDFSIGYDSPFLRNKCQPIRYNEIRTEEQSTDNDEYIELRGQPGVPLNGLTLVIIGDSTSETNSGVVENNGIVDLSGRFMPADGLFSVGTSAGSLSGSHDAFFASTTNNIENLDNLTFLLVRGWTGSPGQDLDFGDAGSDISDLDQEWHSVEDSVSILGTPAPGAGGEAVYSPTVVGPADATISPVERRGGAGTDDHPVHIIWCGTEWKMAERDVIDFLTYRRDTPSEPNICDVCATGVGSGVLNIDEECDLGAATDDRGALGRPGNCCNAQCQFRGARQWCEDGSFCTVGDGTPIGPTPPPGAELCSGTSAECPTGISRTCPDDGSPGGACTFAVCNERDDVCENEIDPFECLIDGVCYDADELNPANDCEYCDGSRAGAGGGPSVGDDFWSALEPGTTCDDGAFCNVGETCDGEGTCGGGSARDCTDSFTCTNDNCNEAADECRNPVRAGSCVVFVPFSCGGLIASGAGGGLGGGLMCVTDGFVNPCNECQVCDSSRERNDWSSVADGTPCDDDLFCTIMDRCGGGECGGTARSCFDGLDCTLDSCDEDADECVNEARTGCMIDGACVAPGGLNPDNSCEACQPLRDATDWTALVSGTSCDDGAFCTTGDICDGAGLCEGEARDCGDGDLCTLDSCDDAADACVNTRDDAGCTIDGACVANGVPNPDNPCEVCDSARDATDWSPLAMGSPCDDGLFCTRMDACNAAGVCTGTARTCDDLLSCTTDSCDDTADACVNDLTAGCVIDGTCVMEGATSPLDACAVCDSSMATDVFSPAAVGTSCDDGSACTVSDACDAAGACVGTTRDCDDGLTCTADSCDRASGCVNSVTTGCAIDGACVDEGDSPEDEPCLVCDPETDDRTYTPLAAGEVCADPSCADGMITTSACDADGVCVGTTDDCPDGGACADEMTCGGGCTDDTECPTASFCDVPAGSELGECVEDLDPGAECDRDDMCADDACTDGVCCDDACDGTCEACNSDGECVPVPEDEDPDDECDGVLSCDGERACQTMDVTPDGGADDDAGMPGTDAGRDGGTTGGDGGGIGTTDAGGDGDTGSSGGCGCVVAGQSGPAPEKHAAWLLLVAGVFFARRRRR